MSPLAGFLMPLGIMRYNNVTPSGVLMPLGIVRYNNVTPSGVLDAGGIKLAAIKR